MHRIGRGISRKIAYDVEGWTWGLIADWLDVGRTFVSNETSSCLCLLPRLGDILKIQPRLCLGGYPR